MTVGREAEEEGGEPAGTPAEQPSQGLPPATRRMLGQEWGRAGWVTLTPRPEDPQRSLLQLFWPQGLLACPTSPSFWCPRVGSSSQTKQQRAGAGAQATLGLTSPLPHGTESAWATLQPPSQHRGSRPVPALCPDLQEVTAGSAAEHPPSPHWPVTAPKRLLAHCPPAQRLVPLPG